MMTSFLGQQQQLNKEQQQQQYQMLVQEKGGNNNLDFKNVLENNQRWKELEELVRTYLEQAQETELNIQVELSQKEDIISNFK